MAPLLVRIFAFAILVSVAACASIKPGQDAAGRYKTGVNGGGGE